MYYVLVTNIVIMIDIQDKKYVAYKKNIINNERLFNWLNYFEPFLKDPIKIPTDNQNYL